MITSPNGKGAAGRGAKIYFLKEQRWSLGKQKERMQLSAVHLSSIIQTQKKDAVNQEMMELARKINEANPFRPFLLNERPKSQQHVYRGQHLERALSSSPAIKSRKADGGFYLSEIAGERWNEQGRRSCKEGVKYERTKSSKNNYNLRKYEFKSFLKEREAKPVPVVSKEVNEVLYEKELANKWGEAPMIHSARTAKISMRRKHFEGDLQVLGNSFLARKEGETLELKV